MRERLKEMVETAKKRNNGRPEEEKEFILASKEREAHRAVYQGQRKEATDVEGTKQKKEGRKISIWHM